MSAHTPGPWRALEHGRIADRNGRLVAKVHLLGLLMDGESDGEHESLREANARLIAAAPALLEALERAEELLENLAEGWSVDGHKAILALYRKDARPLADKARAAIRAAKGETA
jgi:hypothetical protein